MRKNLIALLGFLSGAAVYYMKAPVRETASIQDDFHQQEFVSTSQAAPSPAIIIPKTIPVATETSDPAAEETEIIPGLPRGMKFAPNVKAIPEDQYSEGKILLKKNGFIFFKGKSSGDATANVVYDQRLNTFHPLTATIKLSGVNELKRNEILKAWEEYHYNADLEVQYIQSSHETLFKDYEDLKTSGAKVSLEIIQAVYQSR